MSLGGSSSLKYTEEPFSSWLESKERKYALDLTPKHLNTQYFTSFYMKLKDFLMEMLDLLHVGLCLPDLLVLLQHLLQLSLQLFPSSLLLQPPLFCFIVKC